ncbi:hypothetical protein D3C84_459770 [compost metagenome]
MSSAGLRVVFYAWHNLNDEGDPQGTANGCSLGVLWSACLIWLRVHSSQAQTDSTDCYRPELVA